MKQVLTRHATQLGAGAGLFRHDHFQVAYNTTDLDRALEIFRDRFGVREVTGLDGQMPAGGNISMRIGWAGGVMYELLWAEGPGSEVFRAGLPDQGFAIRPHHLGYYVSSTEEWDALRREIDQARLKVVNTTNVPGFLQAIIVEDPDFPQYLEYILPEAGGMQFFETAPSN